jgi:hypothetical protein
MDWRPRTGADQPQRLTRRPAFKRQRLPLQRNADSPGTCRPGTRTSQRAKVMRGLMRDDQTEWLHGLLRHVKISPWTRRSLTERFLLERGYTPARNGRTAPGEKETPHSAPFNARSRIASIFASLRRAKKVTSPEGTPAAARHCAGTPRSDSCGWR